MLLQSIQLQKRVAGTLDLNTAPVDVSSKELVINGIKIDFSGSATTQDVVNKINEYKDKTGVQATVSTNFVKLDQTEFGSNASITVGGADAVDFGGAVTAGVDAVATVVGPNGASEQVTGMANQ